MAEHLHWYSLKGHPVGIHAVVYDSWSPSTSCVDTVNTVVPIMFCVASTWTESEKQMKLYNEHMFDQSNATLKTLNVQQYVRTCYSDVFL